MHQKFTIPKVSKKDTNKWFVYFRFNGKQKRIKAEINRYKTYNERLTEANSVNNKLTIVFGLDDVLPVIQNFRHQKIYRNIIPIA
ncbi:hypothetical protein SAMN06296427_108140 [Moheibacter sediminis]|uniref:Uncharacterized protein n=1 Tax=Moheibacter sediminis TaxID=1434700 RepID=A0A1W2C518_9FLAO|nr:hypothetical protein SAMN06296427_108140 [Moheibacter sediminis]